MSTPDWKALAKGSYNFVFISSQLQKILPSSNYLGPWVFKFPIEGKVPVSNAMNAPERAVRIARQIHPDEESSIGEYNKGWVMPYIENSEQASDDEIAHQLVTIFKETGRIVIDAAIGGNFLKDSTGKVWNVDVDLALDLKRSRASMNFFNNKQTTIQYFLNDNELRTNYPNTTEIIQNLLYLNKVSTQLELAELPINYAFVKGLSPYRLGQKKLPAPLQEAELLADLASTANKTFS